MEQKPKTKGQRILEAYYGAWDEAKEESLRVGLPVEVRRPISGTDEEISVTHTSLTKPPEAKRIKSKDS